MLGTKSPMPDDDTPVLELRGITKTFGSVEALSDVDLEVGRGEVMALVGDNGAGKSTLVKCVAGTHEADGGQIFWEATDKDLALLCVEAYNDWMVDEWCGSAPELAKPNLSS